jgi:hypothetical protein
MDDGGVGDWRLAAQARECGSSRGPPIPAGAGGGVVVCDGRRWWQRTTAWWRATAGSRGMQMDRDGRRG